MSGLIYKMERALYNYFNWEDIKKGSDEKVGLLDKQIECLSNQLDELDSVKENYNIGNVISPLTVKFRKELETKMIEKYEEERSLRSIEVENKDIENSIKKIDKELFDFVNLKYSSKLRNCDIARKLNVSESTVTRMNKVLLREINKTKDNKLEDKIII